jgi:hypothetical protein
MAADPSAWARKYLMAASVSLEDLVLIIKGMNLRRFNSIIIQIVIQLVLARVRTVLIIMMENDNNIAGVVITQVNSIRIWRS